MLNLGSQGVGVKSLVYGVKSLEYYSLFYFTFITFPFFYANLRATGVMFEVVRILCEVVRVLELNLLYVYYNFVYFT